MNKKLGIMAMLVTVHFAGAVYADCPTKDAAYRGGGRGYERDAQAAAEAAERDRNNSDILGKCIGGITAISTSPQFPSLEDLFSQAFNRVCHVAREQVRGVMGDANSGMRDVYAPVEMQNRGVSSGVSVENRERTINSGSWLNLFGGK